MNTLRITCVSLLLLHFFATIVCGQEKAPDAGKDLQEAAHKLTFYGIAYHLIPSKGGVRAEWSSTPRIDRRLMKENADRLEKLRAQKYPRQDLIALLKHTNPRVRTLAADLLAKTGDAKVRPLLAALQNDNAATFPKHQLVGYDCGPFGVWYPARLPAWLQRKMVPARLKLATAAPGSQTVGQVVRRLLAGMPVPK